MTRIRIFILLLMYLSIAAHSASNELESITFYTENYPPANYIENGNLKGISIETLKAIYSHINQAEPDVIIVPWARGYRFTLEKSNTALFTMSRTPSRENLFKWVGPLFNSTHVLIAKKDKNYKFSGLAETFYHSVVTIEGDISEISLLQVGFPAYNVAKVVDAKQGFLMLQSERVDMIALSIHGFYHTAKNLSIDPKEYEQVWTINKIGNYIAFNKNTPDSLINTFQKAFDELEVKRVNIKQNYRLPIEDY